MTEPYADVPLHREPRKPTGSDDMNRASNTRWLLLLTVALVLSLGWKQFEVMPAAICGEDCAQNHRIHELATAGSPNAFCGLLSHWSKPATTPATAPGSGESDTDCVTRLKPSVRAGLLRSLFWDSLFLLAYGFLGFLALRGWASASARLWPWILIWTLPFAALFDLAENLLLSTTLMGDLSALQAMRIVAICKFTLAGIGALAIICRLWMWCATLKRGDIREALSLLPDADSTKSSLFGRIWLAARAAGLMLLLIRVPLLIALTGVVLTRHVPQVAELFDLSRSSKTWALATYLASGVAGLLVWFSARTLYAFNWSAQWAEWPPAKEWQRIGEWLPRFLGALVPLTMLIGFASRPALDGVGTFYCAWLYALQAIGLTLLMSRRRALLLWLSALPRIGPLFDDMAPQQVDGRAPVGQFAYWREISAKARRFHGLGPFALLAAVIVGAFAPQFFDFIGPQALILFAAAWTVWASTLPIYLASRTKFPLLLGGLGLVMGMSAIGGNHWHVATLILVVLLVIVVITPGHLGKTWGRQWVSAVAVGSLAAVVLTFGGGKLHAVRLSVNQSSVDDPQEGLEYGDVGRPRLHDYIARWLISRTVDSCPQIYLVSAEGGGIRAAMWTTRVLERLQDESLEDPKGAQRSFWECTIAASGVSGGSLGLAVFAATIRDLGPHGGRQDDDNARVNSAAVEQLGAASRALDHDFLGPVLGRMFGTDQLQALLPAGLFPDRGQALEDRWRRRYQEQVFAGESGSFDAPLSALLCPREGKLEDKECLLTALLLNTTAVATGQRLVQHPFAPASEVDSDVAICDLATPGRPPHQRPADATSFAMRSLSRYFPGAIDGPAWMPRELPLFSAVLNSARFTYASPAGSVYCRNKKGDSVLLGQVVDGGYFENSATITLADFWREMQNVAATPSDLRARVRVVHISNDPGIQPLMAGGQDECTKTIRGRPAEAEGGLLAPAIALLNTRDARGDQARRHFKQEIGNAFYHFRLCESAHPLPLGWTLGKGSIDEMADQLDGKASEHAKGLPEMFAQVLGK